MWRDERMQFASLFVCLVNARFSSLKARRSSTDCIMWYIIADLPVHVQHTGNVAHRGERRAILQKQQNNVSHKLVLDSIILKAFHVTWSPSTQMPTWHSSIRYNLKIYLARWFDINMILRGSFLNKPLLGFECSLAIWLCGWAPRRTMKYKWLASFGVVDCLVCAL